MRSIVSVEASLRSTGYIPAGASVESGLAHS